MSALYVTVVVDLDDGQGGRGIGPVTTWPGWNGTATRGIASVPQTATLTGSDTEALAPPTIRVRASDDPLLAAPATHYWHEALTNVEGHNPPVYSGPINYADGATQYLSVLRLAALTTATATTGPLYLTRAEWLAGNGYAHPDGTSVTQDADGTLHASAGHSFDSATPAADVAGGTVGTAATINHADHAHPLSSAYATAAGLTAETSARQAADTSEASTRAAADTTLQTNITAEATTRAAADTTNTTAISTHAARTDNPHSVTAAQVGAAATTHASTHITGGADVIPDAVYGTASGLLARTAQDIQIRVRDWIADPAGGVLQPLYATLQNFAGYITALKTAAYRDVPSSGNASATQVPLGSDTRLTDARTPTAHASSHVTGGSDVIANAVASGNAGLLTGSDKAKLDGIAAGATANTGTVTSAALSLPGVIFDSVVPGSPITTSGTFAPTLKTQTANTGLYGPASGAAAAPTMRAQVVADLPAVAQQERILARYSGKPPASIVIGRYDVPTGCNFTIPTNATNSIAKATTSATASTTFSLQKNSVQFGTVVFGAAGTTGTWTVTATSFTGGTDYLTIVAPGTPDATLADIYFTILGSLS